MRSYFHDHPKWWPAFIIIIPTSTLLAATRVRLTVSVLATLALIALLTLALAWWYYLGGKLPCQDKEPNCSKCGEKIEDSTGRAYTKHWMRKWEVMHGWCADGEGSEVKAEAAEVAA
jgi:hypothetical protein